MAGVFDMFTGYYQQLFSYGNKICESCARKIQEETKINLCGG
jgi:hypothetical protein